MDQDRLWLLIARNFSNEATPEELQELEEMFRKHPDIQYAYLLMNELGEATNTDFGIDEATVGSMQQEGLRRLTGEETVYPWAPAATRHPFKKRMLAFSVLACLAIAITFFAINRKPHTMLAGTEVSKKLPAIYKATETSSIVLQDGTKVWLNRGSTLRCGNNFDLRDREVYLDGEAFFDVASSAKKPFIVHAGRWMDIKVLGTSFNVKAYPGDPYVETALVTGKIAVNIKNEKGKEVVLEPRQKISFDTRSEPVEGQPAETGNEHAVQIIPIKENQATRTLPETAWMENKLAFDDVTFEALAYDLERIYDKKIEFKDERIKAYHLTGEFKNESINQVLDALQITTPFHYTISGNIITVTR